MKINSYEGLMSLIGDLGVQANLNMLSSSLRIDGVVDGIQRSLAALHHMAIDGSAGADKTPDVYVPAILMSLTKELSLMRDTLDYTRGVKESYMTCVKSVTDSTSVGLGYGRLIQLRQLPYTVEVLTMPSHPLKHESQYYIPAAPGSIITPRSYSRGIEALPRTIGFGQETESILRGSFAFVDFEGYLTRVSIQAMNGNTLIVNRFFPDGVFTYVAFKIKHGTCIECFTNQDVELAHSSYPAFTPYVPFTEGVNTYDPNSFTLYDNGEVGGGSYEDMVDLLKFPREVGTIDLPFAKLSLLIAMTNRLRCMISA